MIPHFSSGETYEILTQIFDITPHTNYIEFAIDSKYFYYEFNNNHTIRNKSIYLIG